MNWADQLTDLVSHTMLGEQNGHPTRSLVSYTGRMSPPSNQHDPDERCGEKHGFETTHWSIVLKAGQLSSAESQQALATLCQSYWMPLYLYARRRVQDPEKAQDLTQAFFAKVLEKNYLNAADPSRGRFRAFLLTAMKGFMANEWDKETAQKRGGGVSPLPLDFREGERNYQLVPVDGVTADQLFLQNWVRTLLDKVFDRLRNEFAAEGKEKQFEALRIFITPRHDNVRAAEIGQQLGMSEGAVRAAAHRLRGRYRAILRAEIAETVENEDDVEDEIRSLFKAFE